MSAVTRELFQACGLQSDTSNLALAVDAARRHTRTLRTLAGAQDPRRAAWPAELRRLAAGLTASERKSRAGASLARLAAEETARGAPAGERLGREPGWQPEARRLAVWARTIQQLCEAGHQAIVLIGGGQHTRWLLERGDLGGDLRGDLGASLRVTAVLDDRPGPESLAGVPVLPLSSDPAGWGSAGAAVPSSDACEATLLARYAASHPHGSAPPAWPVYTASPLAAAVASARAWCLLPDDAEMQVPRPNEPATVADRLKRIPDWCTGHIDASDAVFLTRLYAEVCPAVTIEIGIASGVSSAVLASAAAEHGPPGAIVRSYDADLACYHARDRRVGSAAPALCPCHLGHLELHAPADAGVAAAAHAAESVCFAFLDADHRHPAPTLDLLDLLPALAPGAWVALHDVELPDLPWAPSPAETGPRRLFRAWPFEKRQAEGRGPAERNIAAVRLPTGPHAHAAAAAVLLDLLAEPADVGWPDRPRLAQARACMARVAMARPAVARACMARPAVARPAVAELGRHPRLGGGRP